MSMVLGDVVPVVLRASVFLAIGSLLALALSSGKRYPRLQRGVWFVVLLQGLIFLRFDLSSQWFPPVARNVIEDVRLPEANIAADLSSLPGRDANLVSQLQTPDVDRVGKVSWSLVAACTWIVGMLVAVGWQAFAYVKFLRRVEYVETPSHWERDWSAACKESKLDKHASVRATANVGPLVCRVPGEYRLLLPMDQWSELTESQRATILRHEIAHIQRGDIWKAALMRLLAVPHWFNPFAWLAVRRFEDCAEWACDDATQASMPDAMSDYARALLELGRNATANPSPVSAANGRPLVERIQRVLNPTGKESGMMKTKALLAIAVVGTLTAVNSVRMVEAGQQEPVSARPTSAKPTPPQAPATSAAEPTKFAIKVEAQETEPLSEQGADESPEDQLKGDVSAIPRADEAVINMPAVFKEHPTFKRLREEFKTEIEKRDAEAKRLAESGSADFETYRKQAQQELMAKESRIYLVVFREIQTEVASYARENGIRLVRRATTQPISVAKNAENSLSPKQVVELMNRPIVFIDNQPKDITTAVIARIKEKAAKVPTAMSETVIGVPLLSKTPVVGPVFRRVTWPVSHSIKVAEPTAIDCPPQPAAPVKKPRK